VSRSVDLPALHQHLRERYENVPAYQALWRAAVEGRFPAFREGRGWRVREEDEPRVAVALGLIPRQVAA